MGGRCSDRCVDPEIIVAERLEAFRQRRGLTSDIQGSNRKPTMVKLSALIKHASTGSWTKTFIRDVKSWCERLYDQVDFHITHLLTEHGCYGAYLNRIGKAVTHFCNHCNVGTIDDTRHTLLDCVTWTVERAILCDDLGPLDVHTLVGKMCSIPLVWDVMVSFAKAVLIAKEEAERFNKNA